MGVLGYGEYGTHPQDPKHKDYFATNPRQPEQTHS